MEISIQHKAIKNARRHTPDLEELFVALREHQNKVHPDAKDEEIKKRSTDRLLNHLQKKNKFLKILEVGCGNGSLSAKMAGISKTYVTGMDIDHAAITQAGQLFNKPNLEFIYDSFNENTFDKERFDVIVFAASLQYFPSVVAVLRQAERLLERGGEIHILDTPFFDPEEASAAAQRSRDHYNNMGVPEMADHYFHHDISEFWGFSYRVLYNPANLFNRIFKKGPFYWIAINK